MPVVVTMAVVITKHSAVVSAPNKLVDERQIVSNHFSRSIFPNFFAQKSFAGRTSDHSPFVNNLTQSPARGHSVLKPITGRT